MAASTFSILETIEMSENYWGAAHELREFSGGSVIFILLKEIILERS